MNANMPADYVRRTSIVRLAIVAAALLASACGVAAGDDWPAYMRDNGRSGVAARGVDATLVERWTVRSPAPPRTAWPPPQPGWTELPKVDFDDAFHTVADRDTVYFASSTENKVVALDADTGRTRWEAFADAPVRLAPTLAGGRVYFGADDGRVYCVRRETGEPIWTYEAAPRPDRVLGSGRVMSLWPVRTGVVAIGDRVFFGSGVFPYHRVAMHAANAATGEPIWKRDDLTTYGGLSPQGYLLAAADRLVVMSGRASPLFLDPANGDALFEAPRTSEKGGATGAYGVVLGDSLFIGTQNTLWGTNLTTGKSAGAWPNAVKVARRDDDVWLLRGPPPPSYGRKSISTAKNEIVLLDLPAYRALPRKDAESVKQATRWRFSRPDLTSLIVAGSHLIAGGADAVYLLDAQTGRLVAEHPVDGLAHGLAVAHGRLLVSTSRGTVHCFAPGPSNGAITAATGDRKQPAPSDSPKDAPSHDTPSKEVATLVADAIRTSDVRRGFAVVLGDASPAVGCELARRSELSVTCVVFDPARLLAARREVSRTGLYGHRVTVELATPADDGAKIPFPEYGANLLLTAPANPNTISNEKANTNSNPNAPSGAELLRVVKPCGGVALVEAIEAPPEWREAGDVRNDVRLGATGRWTKLVRGELPGSGWWTHQFADAGGSGSSGDKRVKGRLEVAWFGEPGADESPDRHQRGPAPLVHDGRVYCQGWNFLERQTTLFSFDAYNGVRYWKRNVDGAIRLGLPAVAGNLACDASGVYLAAGSTCTRFSPTTGETLTTYQTPPRADGTRPDWGYLAVAQGLVVGSAADAARTQCSDRLFAFEATTGRLRWTVAPRETRDTTIAVERGRLFYVDNRQPRAADEGAGKLKQLLEEQQPAPYLRTVVAIDLADGATRWERDVELLDCGRWDVSMWGSLQMLCDENVIVLAGAYTIYPSRSKAPPRPRRALALAVDDGRTLWNVEIANKSRPVMMHGALLAEPVFHDLQTGQKILKPKVGSSRETPWSIGPRVGGCGSLSASDCMVFGRGGYTIWRDVESGPTAAFIGMRPGCFINIIPAGGVVVQAEASSGCSCYQSVQCTVVLKPKPSP